MTREALQQIEKQQYLADGTIFSEDYKLQTANYLSPACVPSILADRCYLVYNFLYRIVLVVREMRR